MDDHRAVSWRARGRAVALTLLTGALPCGLLLADGSPRRESAAPRPAHVVFVCEHGSAKSLVAALLFERLAQERGLAASAVSRGTQPDAAVPPALAQALRDDGFDVTAFRPRALADDDLRAATRVIAIGVKLEGATASTGARLSRWDDIPPVSKSYPEARAALVARVEALLGELEQEERGATGVR